MLRVVRVAGPSMSPTLEDGDFVVALGGPFVGRYRVGDVVLVAHASLGLIIKRIAHVDASDGVDGHLELEGDGPLSCSRQSLGRVPRRAILGRAVLRVAPGSPGTSRLARGNARTDAA
jgi:hypothetical protein